MKTCCSLWLSFNAALPALAPVYLPSLHVRHIFTSSLHISDQSEHTA